MSRPTKATILVVDDEPDMREMLAYELNQEGFDVVTADSGLAALDLARRQRFDLVITDLTMPGMDGSQTVSGLKEIDPDIEIIVATGYATIESAVECMKRGACDYIRKPYNLDELCHLLERALERNRLQGNLTLYESSRALLALGDHERLPGLILDVAGQMLRGDAIALLAPAEANAPASIAVRGEPEPSRALLQQLADLLPERGILQLDTGRGGGLLAMAAEGFSAAIGYDLCTRGRTLGALIVLRRSPIPAFGRGEIQRGSVFASELALALDNARLHRALGEKIDEVVATRDQLVQMEKLAIIGRFGGYMAHEVNNPLAIVRANLDALRDHCSAVPGLSKAATTAAVYPRDDVDPQARTVAGEIGAGADGHGRASLTEEIPQILDETLEAVQRIADLMAGFRAMSAPVLEVPVALDISSLVSECIAEMTRSDRQSEWRLAPVTTPVYALGHRADLKTSLLNVLNFASHETNCGSAQGCLNVALEQGRPSLRIEVPWLEFSRSERSRLFDPKIGIDSSRGRMSLDMSLAFAYQLLGRNGAEVSVEAGEGGGTRLVTRFAAPSGLATSPVRDP